ADIFFWAMNPGQPVTIDARGETPEGIADTPARIDVDYEFPGGLKVYWTSRAPDVPGAAGKGIGAQFVGTKGSLVCDYGSRVVFLDGKQMTDIPDVPKTIARSPGHQRNFLDCVKSRGVTQSPLEYVHPMTIPMHLGNISFRLRRRLTWDATKEKVVDDPVANRMLSRSYRAPWWLPA
ncbi:MAG: gfo/Idh/MocA family oxidoreductase, partial [Armatimonadota bacterium]